MGQEEPSDSLGRTLDSQLSDHSLRQAVDGVGQGGLGWKTAVDIAHPALLASQVASRPAVEDLLESEESSGLGSAQALLTACGARNTEASSRAKASLPEDLAMSHSGGRSGLGCQAVALHDRRTDRTLT